MLERILAAQAKSKYKLCWGTFRGGPMANSRLYDRCCPLTMVYLHETGASIYGDDFILRLEQYFDFVIRKFWQNFDDPKSELHKQLKPIGPWHVSDNVCN